MWEHRTKQEATRIAETKKLDQNFFKGQKREGDNPEKEEEATLRGETWEVLRR